MIEPSKKLYILIGILISALLIIFSARFFTRERSSQAEEGGPVAFGCSDPINYQGDVYNTVEISGQCWLAENLRAVSYRDGTAIPNLADSAEWAKTEEGAYACYYNQDKKCQEHGALYNWHAVNNKKGICPEGWGVPTDEQWTELEGYDLNTGLGGFRNSAGPFSFLDERGFWWTPAPSGDFASAVAIDKENGGMRIIESSKSSGFSVRCIRDSE